MPPASANRRDTRNAAFSVSERAQLYATRHSIGTELQKKISLRIPFDVYLQDPSVAASNPALGFDHEFYVPWEPGLSAGPTSARFAVVDYDGGTETLTPPCTWDSKTDAFLTSDGTPLTSELKDSWQFHQLHVWAIVQRALDFFENGFGLGRSIPWGFEGNRLIVVPHAGYGENAYYDRHSKSLQFYYFEAGANRVYTCLSADIVNHEFGHAMLDGIRPLYIEAITPQTAAFHEFIGDLTAILIAFRSTAFRKALGAETHGDLSAANALNSIAEEFGRAVTGNPYLRSALNPMTMQDVANDQRPHRISEVLTGAVFDIVIKLSEYYADTRKHSVGEALWYTIQRMQKMAIQPLDLLPPVDVTFRDYALAMLRAEEIANPTDPDNYRGIMLEIFVARGILEQPEADILSAHRHVFERLRLTVFHDIEVIARSRAEAYRFLDDNRQNLLIPDNVDVVVTDLYTAQKLTREARRLPRQIVLEYLWREDVSLEGSEHGQFAGQITTLLCGGTLVIDQNGTVLSWTRKPGTIWVGDSDMAKREAQQGQARKDALLKAVAARVKLGQIGEAAGGARGFVPGFVPPFTSHVVDGALRFELSPHFGIHDDNQDELGSRQWQISS